MAREDVNIKVSANVAEAIRLWQSMEEGPQGMAKELESMGSKGKQASRGLSSELDKLVGKWVSITEAINVAKRMFTEFSQMQRDEAQRRGDVSMSVDDAARRLMIQSGAPREAFHQMRQQVLDTAARQKMSPVDAFAVATQLVSSGFGYQEVVEGGALGAFAEGLSATNAVGPGADPRELAFAATGYLKATGQDLTAANLGALMQNIFGLFQSTNLQAGNLARFASEAATIQAKAGLGNQMLAPLSQLLDVTDESKASTAFRGAVMSLATAGANSTKAAGLAQLGLTPADVDFDGESFGDVQARLTERLQRMPRSERNIALQRIFGQEAMLFADTLLTPEGVAETRRRWSLGEDRRGYQNAVELTRGSLAAQARLAEVAEAQAFYAEDATHVGTLEKRLEAQRQQRGIFGRMVSRMGESVGGLFNPETAAFLADPSAFNDSVEASRAEPVIRIEGSFTIKDQNQVAIPAESEIHRISRPKRDR